VVWCKAGPYYWSSDHFLWTRRARYPVNYCIRKDVGVPRSISALLLVSPFVTRYFHLTLLSLTYVVLLTERLRLSTTNWSCSNISESQAETSYPERPRPPRLPSQGVSHRFGGLEPARPQLAGQPSPIPFHLPSTVLRIRVSRMRF
jgi:hypothetical protein